MIKIFSFNWLKFLPAKINSLFNLFIFLLREYKKIKKTEVIFFFPFYHTGGAEKVHLDIVNSFKNNSTYIFFEGKSETDNNKKEFIKNSNYYEVFEFLNSNKYTSKLFLIYLSGIINKSESIVTLFASNSSVFYKLIPNIKKNIKKIDLTHAFSYPDKGGEISSLPFVSYLTNRVVINKKTSLDFKNLYSKNDLNHYFDRIKIIQNGIHLKNINLPTKDIETINICFVGRWSKEKRPELFLKIANKMAQKDSLFKFYFIGTDEKAKQEAINKSNVKSIGELKNFKDLEKFYKKFHYILITSYREGFPMVLMEAMSFGVVPICTNVGGISEHLFEGENGFLINNYNDEEKIINEFIKVIKSTSSKTNYKELSNNAFNYAQENFNIDNFKSNYRKLVLAKS